MSQALGTELCGCLIRLSQGLFSFSSGWNYSKWRVSERLFAGARHIRSRHRPPPAATAINHHVCRLDSTLWFWFAGDDDDDDGGGGGAGESDVQEVAGMIVDRLD